MKNITINIFGGVITLVFIYFIFFYKSDFILTDEIKGENTVIVYFNDYNYTENYIYVGLDLMGIDSAFVSVFDLPTTAQIEAAKSNLRLLAFIEKVSDNVYVIYIDKNLLINTRDKVLAHELIHLKQYHENRLQKLFGGSIFKFDNEFYISREHKYNTRPWELEAYELEDELNFSIKAVIY